jgi:gamma-glutamyl:cysteine ligase YbdK (ATP-grasp superfamily)
LTVDDARRELAAARAEVVQQLDGTLRLAVVGTHPASTRPSAIMPRDRFRAIARDWVWAARRGQPSGQHVHVGLSDPREALAV